MLISRLRVCLVSPEEQFSKVDLHAVSASPPTRSLD
jgi:hypothetical protein